MSTLLAATCQASLFTTTSSVRRSIARSLHRVLPKSTEMSVALNPSAASSAPSPLSVMALPFKPKS